MSKFDSYHQLLEKVDKYFDSLYQKHQEQFQCKASCHSCCKPKIRVSNVEKEHIKAYLLNHPALITEIKENNIRDLYRGERCSFLDQKGKCSIYSARPIVCRTHGAPLWYKDLKDEDRFIKDVCPLNFSELSLDDLGLDDFINMDTVNSILSVINRIFEKEELLKEGVRHELSLEGLGIKDPSQRH